VKRTLRRRLVVITIATGVTGGCGGRAALERLTQARALTAELTVQFTRAGDAANKAVMADTDEASIGFARDAEQAKQAVRTSADGLQAILQELGYAEEGRLLQEFVGRFAEYSEMDRRILDLAVQNTNLKAQRLSFGPALEAADAFRDAIGKVAARDGGQIKAPAATAIAAVREIQALQAPHIAEPDDAAMTRMEARIAAAEAAARSALQTLTPLVSAASRPGLAAAAAALDRFMALHAEITALSRRNTNVHSLALSLNEKGKLTRACEDSLRALRTALDGRGFSGTR
jgi:hypothetical protein